MTNEPKRWLNLAPRFCETCDGPIHKVFYDARTNHGPWACMCSDCFTNGLGINKLGTGLGQEYTENKLGHWIKTGG